MVCVLHFGPSEGQLLREIRTTYLNDDRRTGARGLKDSYTPWAIGSHLCTY